MKSHAISVSHLSVEYDNDTVLNSISCDVRANKLTAIIGPNGAGKSTLLKALLGLIPIASGRVEFKGMPLKKFRKRISYVPQRAQIDWSFPATVFDVVAMGLYSELGLLRRFSAKHASRVEQVLSDVGMYDLANRHISKLSGGQQQRVFLARAIVQNAELILLDEPFAGIDAQSEAVIIEILKQQRDMGKSIVAVHHDLSTVHDYFDDVVLLNRSVISSGSIANAFTKKNIEKTYGMAELGSVAAPL